MISPLVLGKKTACFHQTDGMNPQKAACFLPESLILTKRSLRNKKETNTYILQNALLADSLIFLP